MSFPRWVLSVIVVLVIAVVTTTGNCENFASNFLFPVGEREVLTWTDSSNPLGNSWSGGTGHLGVDYWMPSAANEPVYAVANGTVSKVYYGGPSWRGVVIVRHELPAGQSFDFNNTVLPANLEVNPTNLGVIYSLYGHLKNIPETLVEGQEVGPYTLLGYLCAQCFNPNDCDPDEVSWVPHLHFEIKNQTAIDEAWNDGVGHGYSGTRASAPNHYRGTRFILNNSNPSLGPFHDVPHDYWAEDEIAYVAAREIAQGVGGFFYPENPVTRAELCTMISRARKLSWNESWYDGSFVDVSRDHSHCEAIYTFKHFGWVSGVGNHFYPDNPIMRRNAAKIVFNGFEFTETFGGTCQFWLDFGYFDDNYSYARELCQYGIMNGFKGYFHPNKNLSRAEMAAVIYRTLQALEEN